MEMAQENLESTNTTTKPLPPGLSIWPPTQRTREAVVSRLVETLTNPTSVFSKRFGTIPSSDVELMAKSIENEAVAAVSSNGSTKFVEEGIKALQLYSKEVSARLLSSAKSRAPKDSKESEACSSNGEREESGEVKDEEDSGSVVNSESTSA